MDSKFYHEQRSVTAIDILPAKSEEKKNFAGDLEREVMNGFDALVYDPRAGDWDHRNVGTTIPTML